MPHRYQEWAGRGSALQFVLSVNLSRRYMNASQLALSAAKAKPPPLGDVLAVLRQIMGQDLEPDPNGGGLRIVKGTAKDRRISVEEGEMRHGRKSKSKRINGYKRHIATDLDSQAILACALTPANQAEHEALPMLKSDIDTQEIRFREAHFDRGYMGSPTVDELEDEGAMILCKPWPSHNTRNEKMFTKKDFNIDLRSMTITCPGNETQYLNLGQTIYFGAACDRCPLRNQRNAA